MSGLNDCVGITDNSRQLGSKKHNQSAKEKGGKNDRHQRRTIHPRIFLFRLKIPKERNVEAVCKDDRHESDISIDLSDHTIFTGFKDARIDRH